MADTKKSENYSLPVGGTPAKGVLVTNIDTGVVQWFPKKTIILPSLTGAPNVTQTISDNYLESTYNTDTKKWEWKAVNKATDGTTVYSDIRNKSENPAVANQYSTDDSVANEVNTNSVKELNKTIDNNWDRYGVGLTAKRGKLGYEWVRNSNTAEENPEDPGVKETLDNAPDTFTISNIPLSTKTRDNYGNYYYPSSLETNTNKQDVIKFTVKKIVSAKGSTEFGEKTFQTQFEDLVGSVTLPIQPMISDSNTVDWAGLGLGPLGAYGAAASLELATGSKTVGDIFQSGSNILRESLQKLLDESTGYKQAVSLYIAQEAAGIQGLLSRATGSVINNNLELLFQGPQLRPFNFQFTMSPRSAPEATQVKNIIRFFKQAMSVKNATTNTFLKSPFVFDIRYLVNGSTTEHPSINRIKTCALTACDVDYTPGGTYMTFSDPDRTMTSYNISLRFSELEPVYESDYHNPDRPLNDNEIGF